jgi:amidase
MQCHSVDTLGLMARTLDDIALFRGAVLALPPSPIERGISAPRIGFLRTPVWDHAEADTQALLEKTAGKLSAAGATVIDVAFAPAFGDILDDHAAIAGCKVCNYADERLRSPDKVSRAT